MNAQTIQIKATPNVLNATLLFSPSAETVIVGSTFDVSVYLDTHGTSANTVDLGVRFPADKLTIVKPAADKSLISVWLEPPVYSNTDGTAHYAGIIPNGITTASGLIATITFKAVATGNAVITISPTSRVLANDGLGTEMATDFGRGTYVITPQAPEGPQVFSETHPFQDRWYNNPNPVIAWQKDPSVTDFNYVLDDKPFTVPDNISVASDTVKAYENLGDGLWYFHIKAKKEGVWGSTTHFLVRIDTSPPAEFTPKAEILTAAIVNRVLVSFFTTDALSGINHYEVGVIDKAKSTVESPAFVQTDSPYQLPNSVSGNLRVVVRAIDRAGNVRDESVDVILPSSLLSFLLDRLWLIVIIIALMLFAIHYLYGHRILAHLRKAFRMVEREEKEEERRADAPMPLPPNIADGNPEASYPNDSGNSEIS